MKVRVKGICRRVIELSIVFFFDLKYIFLKLKIIKNKFFIFLFIFSNLLFSQESLDKLLELDLNELLSLKVISATKIPETISSVPATCHIITKEQIMENGYITLEDALMDLPGFQFRDILGFNSYVFLRGIPSQNNLILLLVDGILLNELNSGGFYGGGQYNLSNVERIEVVLGPASSLYGTNAVSGIINIITKDPEIEKNRNISILGGSFNTFLSDFNYSYLNSKKNIGFNLSGMIKKTDKADLSGKKGDYMWTEKIDNFEDDYTLEGKFFYKKLISGFLLQDKNASRATVQKTSGTNLSDSNVNWHIRFLNIYAKYIFFEKEKYSLKTTSYYRNSEVMDDTIPVIELKTEDFEGKQYRYFRPANLIGQETILNLVPDKKFNLVFGFLSERERLSSEYSITESNSEYEKPQKPPKPLMLTNELYSIFGQTEIYINDSFEVFIGYRYDDSNYYGNVLTPRFGIIYKKNIYTGKLLYMEAFRAPKPWDYTSGLGNKNLKPEEIKSIEFANIIEISRNMRLETSLYKNRIDNLLIKEYVDENWRWINSGEIETDGLELLFIYRKGKYKGTFDYTFNSSEDENGKQIPEISKHIFGFQLYYYLNEKIGLGIRGRYYGERENPKTITSTGSNKIESFSVFSSTINLKLSEKIKGQLSIENLFNSVYYHTSNLQPDRYRQPGRAIYLRVGYDF